MSIATLYLNQDFKTSSRRVWIDDAELTDVLRVEWSFGFERIPEATVRVPNPPPAAAVFGAEIRIDIGFNNLTQRVFTGTVLDLDPDETGTNIRCQGKSAPLDNYLHKVVIDVDGSDTAEELVEGLFDLAGIGDYLVDLPSWTPGTNVEQTLEFETYGEAITKVSEVDGGRWREMPTGEVRVEVMDPIPSLSVWRTYFSMVLGAGYAESYPSGTTSGRPRIRGNRGSQRARDVKNRAYVRGATYTQTAGDGTENSIDIEGEASATSPWVLKPDGSQAYNDLLFSNELIDDATKAGEVAARLVVLYNRLAMELTVEIDGDPQIVLGATVRIRDPAYTGIDSRWFVEAYSTLLEGRRFVTTLTLIGGDQIGGTVNIHPFALFTHTVDRQIMGDREWAIVGFDGCISTDPDGEIVGYEWWDNQTPMLISGSDCAFSVRVDPATVVDPWDVTLRVTDDDGATDEITLGIGLDPGGAGVTIPSIYAALSVYGGASPDGGLTWYTQAISGTCISVGAKHPDMLQAGVAVYGTHQGEIYYTHDFLQTAPDLALDGLASPVVHLIYDLNNWLRCWAATEDGRIYVSYMNGYSGTWYQYEDLRTKFSLGGLVLSRLATPKPQGLWAFGGTGQGCPLIAWDAGINHLWIRANIAGELEEDTGCSSLGGDLIPPAGAEGPIGVQQSRGSGNFLAYSAADWSTLSTAADEYYVNVKNLAGTLFRIAKTGSIYQGPGSLERSPDGGVTWTTVWARSGSAGVQDYDRAPDGTLWALYYGGGGAEDTHVYRSLNDGETWNFVVTPPAADIDYLMAIACDPTDSSIIAAIGHESPIRAHIFYTTNGGSVWSTNATNDSFDSNWAAHTLMFGDDHRLIWANNNRDLLRISDDYGANWTVKVSVGSGGVSHREMIRGDASDEFLYLWAWSVDGLARISRSTDNGDNWTQDWQTDAHFGVNNQAFAMARDEATEFLYVINSTIVASPAVTIVRSRIPSPSWGDVSHDIDAESSNNNLGQKCVVAPVGQVGQSDLRVAEAASREEGELAIILTSEFHTPAVYYTPAIFGDGSDWTRALNCPSKPSGRWIAPDYSVDRFAMGFDDWDLYLGDVDPTTDVMTISEAIVDLDTGDVQWHGLWIGALMWGLSGVYLVAACATGTTDGTIYKSFDRFTTVGKLYPATGFDAPPTGTCARMVQVGAQAALKTQATLYAGESPLTNGNYARHFSKLTASAWTLQDDPGAAAQDPIGIVKKLGANLYRIIGDDQMAAISHFCVHPGQLRRSTDEGQNWTNVGPTPVTDSGDTWGPNDMIEGADGTLWLCCCPDDVSNGNLAAPAVYRSINDGVTWTKVYEDTTKDTGNWRRMISIVAHPSNANVIAAVGDRNPGVSLVWVTENGGGAWATNNGSSGQSVGGARRAVMMDNARIVMIRGTTFYYTDDYGATAWSTGAGASLSTYQYCLARGGTILFASGGTASVPRVLRSLDYGLNWTQIFDETDVGNAAWTTKYSGLQYDPVTDTLYVASDVEAGDAVNTFMVFSLASAAQASIGLFKDLTYDLSDGFGGHVGVNGLAR